MKEKLREAAKALLKTGNVVGILGLKEENGNIGPYFFTKQEDLDFIELNPRYSIAKICKLLQSRFPNEKFGVIVRGCEERAILELAKRKQMSIENIDFIGVACNLEEAKECNCARPYPTRVNVGEKVEGVKIDTDVENLRSKDLNERLEFWKREFSKCIKCYGCRNICPECVCKNCILEDWVWVKGGELPPEIPSYHLIHAYHMADKCINCGECENTCPVGIPLTKLYQLMLDDMKVLFDYEPGADKERNSPLVTTLEEAPISEGKE